MLSTPMYIIAYERSLLQIGSGLLLPAQWEGGARANIDLAAARNSPKEKRGANGKFLPKPLLFHLRQPNSKKISRVYYEILSPKNSFAKTSSALVPPPVRILGGQNTKEKCPFLFRRNLSRANPKSKEHFSLVSAEALRGGGGADSFVQFPLEKSSRKVYNYSTMFLTKLFCKKSILDAERLVLS